MARSHASVFALARASGTIYMDRRDRRSTSSPVGPKIARNRAQRNESTAARERNVITRELRFAERRRCSQATHELEPDLILSKVLEQYRDPVDKFTSEYAAKNRDMVLDALSDSGTVAPLIMTANLHSWANTRSYMYVFSHPKAMRDYPGVSRSPAIQRRSIIARGSEDAPRAEPDTFARKMLRCASMGRARRKDV